MLSPTIGRIFGSTWKLEWYSLQSLVVLSGCCSAMPLMIYEESLHCPGPVHSFQKSLVVRNLTLHSLQPKIEIKVSFKIQQRQVAILLILAADSNM
jgi:hypothetical protein